VEEVVGSIVVVLLQVQDHQEAVINSGSDRGFFWSILTLQKQAI